MNMDNIDDAYALTPVQKGMLYHCLESPTSPIYVSYVGIQIQGNLHPDQLRAAWQQTIQRHTVLRSGFFWDGLDDPLQVVTSTVELDWQVNFLEQLDQEAQQQRIAELITMEKKQPFDLTAAPLMRFRLIGLAEDEWYLLWVVHHLLADGWSTPIIMDDVLHHYHALTRREAAALPKAFAFTDYVQWINSVDSTDSLAYWKMQLQGATATPIKSAPPDATYKPLQTGSQTPQQTLFLPTAESAALLEFARQQRLTLASVIHAAWALVLREYCDTDAPLFGTTVSGRQVNLPGIDNAVGLFLNTLPVYLTFTGNTPIIPWLRSVQETLHSAADHCVVSLPQIRLALSTETNALEYESIVVVQSHSSDLLLQSADQSLSIGKVEYDIYSNYPLALSVHSGDQIKFSLVFDPTRFNANLVQGMLTHLLTSISQLLVDSNGTLDEFATVVGQAISQSTLPVKSIPTRPSDSLRHPESTPDNVILRFERCCDSQPNQIAIVCGSDSLSFIQLDQHANRIARLLHAKLGDSRPSIGLCLPRSIDQIAAMLGILKSGCSYVPIDPNYPSATINNVVNQSNVTIVIGTNDKRDAFANAQAQLLSISEATLYSSDRLDSPVLDDDALAYIMFTSGSTGTPKGVRITHRNLLYSTTSRLDYYDDEPIRFLLLSSISFDSSVAGIYWSLCSCGTLVLPQPDEEKELEIIADIIQANRVTHTLCLSSLYYLLLEHTAKERLNSLEIVIVAGEKCHPALPQLHFTQLPNTRLFNEYGPTEACVWCSVYEITRNTASPIPIGRALVGSDLRVINSRGLPSPRGIEGRLVVAGSGLAEGYHNNPSLTLKRFVQHSANNLAGRYYHTGDRALENEHGQLVYIGRDDRQMKIRGYRIEPGEIENTIHGFPGISEVVVIARERSNNGATTIEHTTDSNLDDQQLLTELNKLPESIASHLLDEITNLSLAEASDQLGAWNP